MAFGRGLRSQLATLHGTHTPTQQLCQGEGRILPPPYVVRYAQWHQNSNMAYGRRLRAQLATLHCTQTAFLPRKGSDLSSPLHMVGVGEHSLLRPMAAAQQQGILYGRRLGTQLATLHGTRTATLPGIGTDLPSSLYTSGV